MNADGLDHDLIFESLDLLFFARLVPDREDKLKSSIEISYKEPDAKPKPETLVVEASIKPYINLVWMGTVTLVVGFALTIFRRVAEAREKQQV